MKNVIKILSLLAFLSFNISNAQVVEKKETHNGTELKVSMDSRVNELLTDLEGKCDRVKEEEANKIVTPKVEIPTKPKTNAEICRDNPRILGYKIQVAVVKSNEEANKVKSYFRTKFPNMKAETDASLRPNYKVLVGSYFSKQSASGDLARIRSYFPAAIAVQYRVFCVEAK
jgi:hypothetical protein